MFRQISRGILGVATAALALPVLPAYAQSGTQGIVSVTVDDVSGGAVAGADLKLTAEATNVLYKAHSQGQGTFRFVNLPIGTYHLQVSKSGYSDTDVTTVIVQASQVTPVRVMLKVGHAYETVTVSAAATPLLDTTSNALGTVIDMKQIEDLPLLGRDLTSLASLTPGFTGVPNSSNGVWNGQPFANQGVNIDGVIGASERGKYYGAAQAAVSPRIENIAEMSVETDQIDLDQGFGRSSMQINFVTRSGTNKFHGRAYIDSRNSGLFANSYSNNAAGIRRAKVIYNDFGGSVGGPILRDKLFFFGSFSTRRVPQDSAASNNYLTTAAQKGDFTYTGTDGASHTVNLFTLAQNYGGLPTTTNATIASELTAINSAVGTGGAGSLATADANINTINWNTSAPLVYYYPTVRVDYNATAKLHMYLSWNMTQESQSGSYPADFPGSTFSDQSSGYKTRNFTAGYGVDYQLTPNIVNQFKVGYLYDANQYGVGAKPLYDTNPMIYWNLSSWPTTATSSATMSGQVYTLPVSNFYPNVNLSDSISWQKGTHSLKFGWMWNREQDHYWNPPAGFNNVYLGLASGDPAVNAFTASTLPNASSDNLNEAQQMYAVLAGRISSISGSYSYSPSSGTYDHGISAYNLDERQSASGLFFQDSWRAFPTLTLNYGMRWDFTGDNYDLTGAYHSATEASLYGPSGVGNLFQPGFLDGTNNPTIDTRPHTYAPWNVSPQPAFGFAWNPRDEDGAWGKILGNGNTVVRGGFNLRRFTMPAQYYWDNASSYGAFFYQSFYLNANNTDTTGTFAPGSLALGDAQPAFGLSPASYQKSESMSDFTFLNSMTFAGMDYHIKQPYTESWNLGFERKFGNRALEVRYDGNRTLHQWLAVDLNEDNVFENGFLQQFKNAQANYRASGSTTFKGSHPTPVFDAAFAGESTVNGAAQDYTNGNFLNDIATGQVGAMASALSGVSGTTTYFCNMVGSSFAPCANNAGYTGGGAGYPINYFQANPYAAGQSSTYMEAVGYSNYNSLQVDFRQQAWHGWTFDTNYTYGKTLSMGSTQNWTAGGDSLFTVRNLREGYGPTPFDIRHVFHFTSTYDLPFGQGKRFLNSNDLVSRVLGNWTIGSIMTIQSGAAQYIYGGNYTYNDYADSGVQLSGVTPKQLQKAIGVHRIAGTANAALIDPKYLNSPSGGGANTAYINPNTTPGTFDELLWLYGPHGFYHDLSVSKNFPIHDKVQVRLQGEFLNVWNHPVFGSTPVSFGSSVQSSSFGIGTVTNNPRWIELRGNIEF